MTTDPNRAADPVIGEPGEAPAAEILPGPATYTRVAITLHWIIALCILVQIALGWRLHDVPDGPARYAAFQLHKSIGISILLLSVARLVWRLLHPAPPEVPVPRWQRIASAAVHWGLYAIMIGLPLSGWLMVSSSKLSIPTRLFGLVPWPAIPGLSGLEPAAKAVWNDVGHISHSGLVYITIALLLLHFGAVLKHQLLDKDQTFARMAPGARAGWKEPRLWIVAAIVLFAVPMFASFLIGSGAPRAANKRTVAQPAEAPAAEPVPSPSTGPASLSPAPIPTETAAGPTRWAVQGGQLRFSTHWADTPIAGSFSRWTADILFSPDFLDRSSLTVRIDLASVSTGDSQRDAALPTSDWFDTAAHPSATFRSDKIRSAGGDKYVASGTLDLRGVKKSFSVPFTARIKNDSATANGAFTLDRTAFGIGQGDWAATDQIPASVSVKFSLRAKGR